MELVEPTIARLPSYRQALERGWSPDNLRPEAAHAELAAIEREPGAFLARLLDREGKGAFTLPDGRLATKDWSGWSSRPMRRTRPRNR